MPNSLLRRKYDVTCAPWMMFLLGRQNVEVVEVQELANFIRARVVANSSGSWHAAIASLMRTTDS